MRNSVKLLLLSAIALAGVACLLFREADGTFAAPTISGPSTASPAMVLFPISAKPNPGAMGMKPVAFNHKLHESKVQECQSCHHTGDPVSCTSCHTVEGKAEGNFVTLERAMHAVDIAKRSAGNQPNSCVSCHEKVYTEKRECAGCHAVVSPTHNEQWCAACHIKIPGMTKEQLQQGLAGKLSAEENLALATKALQTRKQAHYVNPFKLPVKVTIDTLAKKYKPTMFNHAGHLNSVMERIKDDPLAKIFHTDSKTLCLTCHHHTPASMNPSKCVSCHAPQIDKAHPGRPNLKAAYHLQCMGCHDGMQVARPKKTDCTGCHRLSAEQEGGSK